MPVHSPPQPTLYTRRRRRHLRGRPRRRPPVLLAALVTVIAAVATVAVLRSGTPGPGTPICTVTAAAERWTVNPAQAQSAATISAVATREGLPDHAVTIALATALQESKLINLPGGDRDSVGLFQQRPSQGWGSPAQIRDANYASGAFYGALVKIPGWRTLGVADAAQRVQRSADGSAYAGWEPEARALARAFTGELPASFACSGRQSAPSMTAAALRSETQTAVGQGVFAAGADSVNGWRGAAYLMAQAPTGAITSISYSGRTWSAHRGTWQNDPLADDHLSFSVATPAHS